MKVLSEVGRVGSNKWVRLVAYSLATWLTTCIYYGWQQYSLLLYRGGAFEWECAVGEELPCDAQQTKVASYYSIAAGTEYLFAVVAGTLLDNFGPRVCGVVGEVVWGVGLLLQFFSSESFRAYYYAAFLLGAGVNLVAFPTMILEEIFPKHKNMIISLMIATQTAATALAPISYEIVKATGCDPNLITGIYFVVIYIPVAALLIWTLPWKRPSKDIEILEVESSVSAMESSLPRSKKSDESEDENNNSRDLPEGKIEKSELETDISSDSPKQITPEGEDVEITPPFSCKAFAKELLTVEWIMFTVFYQFSIAGFTYWSTVLGDRWGESYSEFIGWSMLIQGPMGIVFGLLSDKVGTMLICLMIAAAQILTFLVGLSTSVGVQYASGFICVVMQSWIWTTKYCYVAEIFSRTNFGKLAGLVGFISGFMTYLNIVFVNFGSVELWFSIFAGGSVLNLGICGYLYYRSRWQHISYKTYAHQS